MRSVKTFCFYLVQLLEQKALLQMYVNANFASVWWHLDLVHLKWHHLNGVRRCSVEDTRVQRVNGSQSRCTLFSVLTETDHLPSNKNSFSQINFDSSHFIGSKIWCKMYLTWKFVIHQHRKHASKRWLPPSIMQTLSGYKVIKPSMKPINQPHWHD